MKVAKFTPIRRVTALCPSATLMLTVLVLIVSATTTAAQTTVFVPGNTNGCFGIPIDKCVPLVAALAVSGPGTVTVTYVSGTVTDAFGINTGPNGVSFNEDTMQAPLQEVIGVSGGTITNLDALIGVFVPSSRVGATGFKPIDGTKDRARAGIVPCRLFFIGSGKTFSVGGAGTLFLGINDQFVGDNGGGFTVTVTGP
jgi:hypothetical protein